MKSMCLLSNISSFGSNAGNDCDDVTKYYSGMNGIVQCQQLVIDSIRYKYNKIKNKRYLVNRKPYHTLHSFSLFEHDLQQLDNEDGTPP
jgi:hypothetical protein